MKPSRALIGLLAVIAVALVVIAAVLVTGAMDREHTAEWRDARDEARESAETFCSIPEPTDLEVAYGSLEACINEHTKIQLEDWEEENPDAVWE